MVIGHQEAIWIHNLGQVLTIKVLVELLIWIVAKIYP